mmetsp:Transcript_11677/g.33595  ORF Transcript_11677/g.33595 Transcript_11677/m.33595 type:complete len:734 (-) Transcript_11677:459-2660(-)
MKIATDKQEGEETWNAEEERSVFSRLKCRSTADDCDKKYGSDLKSSVESSSKPASNTKIVHKMLTPWLVTERENKRSGRINSHRGVDNSNTTWKEEAAESNSESAASTTARQRLVAESNNENKIKTVEGLTSDQDFCERKTDTKLRKKKENKHSIGTVLFGRRRRAPSQCTATKSCPSSEGNELSLHHLYRVFPHDQSGDLASGNVQTVRDQNRSLEDNSTACEKLMDPPAFHQITGMKSKENTEKIYSIKSADHSDGFSTSVVGKQRNELIQDYSYDNGAFSFGTNYIIDCRQDSDLRTTKTSSTIATVSKTGSNTNNPGNTDRYAMEAKVSEGNIITPRRRNNRSPSPSRLQRLSDLSNPSELSQNRKAEHPQKIGFDREMLMGLEMHRQLDQISSSFDCGTINSRNRVPSISRSQRESPEEKNSRLSVFSASTMSCLNPSSQLNSYGITRDSPYKNIGDENNRNLLNRGVMNFVVSKPVTCNAASALLLDVKDDDPLWQYYENNENLSLQDQTRIGCAHLSRGNSSQILHPSNEVESGSVPIPEERRSCACRSDNSFRVSSATASRYEVAASGSQLQGSEQSFSQCSYRETPFSKTEKWGYPHRNQYTKSCPEMAMSPERGNRYEYLMAFSEHAGHDLESVQHSKQELLEQMRDAVRKASAELDSRGRLQAVKSDFNDRYHIIASETEMSSEGNKHMSERFQRKDQRKETLFASRSINSPKGGRDKYDFN